jgi:hypothetical protein
MQPKRVQLVDGFEGPHELQDLVGTNGASIMTTMSPQGNP